MCTAADTTITTMTMTTSPPAGRDRLTCDARGWSAVTHSKLMTSMYMTTMATPATNSSWPYSEEEEEVAVVFEDGNTFGPCPPSHRDDATTYSPMVKVELLAADPRVLVLDRLRSPGRRRWRVVSREE